MGKEEASSRGEVRSCECEMRPVRREVRRIATTSRPFDTQQSAKKNLSVNLSTGALVRMRRHASPCEPVRDNVERRVAMYSHAG